MSDFRVTDGHNGIAMDIGDRVVIKDWADNVVAEYVIQEDGTLAEPGCCPICDGELIGPNLCINSRNPHHN